MNRHLNRVARLMRLGVAGLSLMPALLSAPAWALPAGPAELPELLAVASPDGQLQIRLLRGPSDTVHLSVLRQGRTVLLPTPMGLVLDGADLSQNLSVAGRSERQTIDERYTLRVSKRLEHHHLAQEQSLLLRNPAGQRLTVTLRAANDGVAFRYLAQAPGLGIHRLQREISSLRFAPHTRAWLQPMQVAKTGYMRSNPAYEEHYQLDMPVGTPSPLPAGWVFPALFRSGPDWVAVSEADMDGSWHASRLAADSTGGEYRLAPPMAEEVMPGGALLAHDQDQLRSPWRLMAIGSLATVMQSTLGTDLAPPPQVTFDAARIQPGHASWSWPLLKDESAVFEVQRRFIDYAAGMGWNYTLIDAGWDVQIGRERIPALVAHGAAQGVGVLLWYNSAGSWNETPLTPRNLMTERASRRAEFAWLREVGVKGVKVDFFGGDGQSVIRYYLDILQDAAEFGLLVNFHGSTLPRGWQRSWPHLMTMEAVKGLEFTTFGQPDQDAVARHAAMLPFARNLFDPMDFTPLVFGDIPGIARRTRNGFELAEAVLFTSGIQHYAEVPTGMASVPEAVRQTLRALPRHWDETRFIAGVPGQHVVLARRSGTRWHVAGLNAGNQPLNLTLDPGFLAGRTGRMISDGRGPREFAQGPLAASRQTRVRLAAHGGLVVVFDSGQAPKDGAH